MRSRSLSQPMKLALDLGPVVLFVLAYHLAGMMAATTTIMVATLVSLAITYWLERKIAIAPLVAGVLVGVFGALTLALNDDTFIKIKPTIVNLILAAIMLGGVVIGKAPVRYVLQLAFQLTDEGWRTLSIRWGVFFIGLALLNEVIWRHFSTDFWVSFKLFGMFTLNVLFWVVNASFLQRHMLPEEPAQKD